MSTESLNFEKLVELEATAKLNHIDIIAVTEVKAQNPDLLQMTSFQEFIRLHSVDHPLGKKRRSNEFAKNCLSPITSGHKHT